MWGIPDAVSRTEAGRRPARADKGYVCVQSQCGRLWRTGCSQEIQDRHREEMKMSRPAEAESEFIELVRARYEPAGDMPYEEEQDLLFLLMAIQLRTQYHTVLMKM